MFLYEIWCFLDDLHHLKAYQEMLNIQDHKYKNVNMNIMGSDSVTARAHFHQINNVIHSDTQTSVLQAG